MPLFCPGCINTGAKIGDLTIFAMIMMKSVVTGLMVMAFVLNAASQNYASSSVLGSGQWVKIAVTEEGIYRLDYSHLKEMGFTDPSSVVLYGNNAGQLSFMNDNSAPDDLRKVAFRAEKGADGVFNEGDYLLFYAEGTHRWVADPGTRSRRFVRHHYSDTAWYFITSQPGEALPVLTETPPATLPTFISSSTDLYMRHEQEEINLIRSGREWYQQVVPGTQNSIGPGFTDLAASGKIHYTIRVAARSGTETSFILREDGETIKTITVPAVTMTDFNGVYAATMTVSDSVVPSSGSPAFTLAFSSGGNMAASGYIDYADFKARASLVWRNRNLFISDSRSVGTSAVTRFTVEGSSSLSIWDITNPYAPLAIETTPSSGNTHSLWRQLTASGDSLPSAWHK